MGSGASKSKKAQAPAPAPPVIAEPVKEPPGATSKEGQEALRSAICDLEANTDNGSDIMLSSFTIEDAGVAKLSRVLTKSSKLEFINLSINQLTDAAAESLAAVIPQTKLRVLMLERNALTASGVSMLTRSLPSTLEKLMLGRNTVGVEGAQALADHVVKLHTLGLGFASLGAEGAQALAPILSKVTVLDLSGNHLNGPGCSILADRLQGSTLEVLKLESNGVGDAGAKSMAAALPQAKKLLHLELRRNSITDQGAKLLAAALEKNTTLRHLDLFDNSLTDAAGNALLASVRIAKQRGSALKKLDLEINDISQSLMAQVNEALGK